MGQPTDPDNARIARDVFGYPALRPGQGEVIDAVVGGSDALAVMATGAGKSAIYAIAGRRLGRPTVIISPLLALQRDQLLALTERGLRAVAVNSAAATHERAEALEEVGKGAVDYVFLAPEQLSDADVVARLVDARVALVAVDEAHLVSQWGPDFRPDYLRIPAALEAVGRPPVLALTATAAPPVRDDITDRLGLRQPFVLVHGFDRPNIHLSVQAGFGRDRDKLEALARDVPHAARRGQGIVYAATRRGVEGLVADWAAHGLRAAAYHAGLGKADRLAVEQRFHAGAVDVVVATVAFGMGVDKPDIRWIFHADIPPSVDEYYQEVGRCGRDGAPADAVLYFRPDDLRIPRLFAATSGPSAETVGRVAAALAELGPGTTVGRVQRAADLSRARTGAALGALQDAGSVRLLRRGAVQVVGDLADAEATAEEAVARRRAVERSRAETMEAYAEHQACRRRFILEYFGEASAERCGCCDNCDSAGLRSDEPGPGQEASDVPFPRGSTVLHPTFGRGQVIGYTDGRVMIGFETAGYKRLDLGLVAEGDLLRPT